MNIYFAWLRENCELIIETFSAILAVVQIIKKKNEIKNSIYIIYSINYYF